jgi:hypothetical protein
MSWVSNNYEKAVLGGTVAVALGLSFLGWTKYSEVEAEFNVPLKGGGNNKTEVKDADLIRIAIESMNRDHAWAQAEDNGRKVDLFTGISLFVSRDAPDKPLDIGSANSTPVHPPIPNSWWIQNRIDPGFADSPISDPDNDGFSNLEEFNAQTNPNNSKEFPPLISKLMFIRDETLTWVLRPGTGSDGKFSFNYQDSKNAINKTDIVEPVGPNGMFFAKGPMALRFMLLGSEVRVEMSQSTKIEREVTILRIEDQRPNKKGTVYEIPAPLSPDRMKEHAKYDRTAVLSLEALGLNGKEFKVEENTAFALPSDNPKKDYLLKKVTPASITVEYTDKNGGKKTVEINKGSVAQILD